ncbi:transposase [Streptomyces sp. NPDC056161]|uniref:transposase n=1 Tax=Streptomyces sp. NPDC056161 TaxID=3345732 RepID=UPI0035DD09F3
MISLPSRARITSPYDPDSRNALKRGSARDGYKVHFTETCDAQESGRPHLITHVATTDATVGDPMAADEIHGRLHTKHLLPDEHLMDAGYISAEPLLTAPSQRGVRVIGPVRPHTRHTVQTADYGKTSFTIDWDARQATCPSGAHSRYWTEELDKNQRPAIRIRFATETCAPCPARPQCTSSTRYGRQLTVRPQDQDAASTPLHSSQARPCPSDRGNSRCACSASPSGPPCDTSPRPAPNAPPSSPVNAPVRGRNF